MNSRPKISEWTHYKSKKPAKIDSTIYEFLSADYYLKAISGVEWSCGVYKNPESKNVLMAWGPKSDLHCSMHAVWLGNKWSDTLLGCPVHKKINNRTIAVQISKNKWREFLSGPKKN